MKVIFYIGSFGGSAYYRFLLPAAHLKKLGHDVQAKYEMEESDTDADIIFIQRTSNEQIYKNCVFMQNKGCVIVYDIDDDLFNLDKENFMHDYFADDTIRNNYEQFLRIADLVTVSTEPLKELYSAYNKNISIVPNYLDFINFDKWFLEKPVREEDGITTIGWAGSPSHKVDIDVIEDALINVLNKYPDVRLKGLGWNFTENVKWDSLRNRIKFIGYNLPDKFAVEMKDFDIAIAPLADTKFNRSKSNLKYLEYSALGIPAVASDVEPYKIIQHGITGLLADSPGQFEHYLETLINNKFYAEHIGLNAYKFVKTNYNLKNKIELYEILITSLIKEKK
jgi:glycosyltransferase involved in cell wall biosynthesis